MRGDGFHAVAWLVWCASAGVVVLAIANPFASVAVLAGLAVVAARFAGRGPEGRAFAVLVKVGLGVLAMRVVLFGLTGHAGETVLATLPRAGLPRLLGGFSVGGPVTAEVVAQQVADGLKIAAFLACAGVLLSAVETYRVLRLVPRFAFEAGLVVGIALTFVPVMLRTAADVRDAQRLRGHRFRGVRSLVPLVVPVLAGALERALTLAASMESRGFGRARRLSDREEAVARAGVLASVVVMAFAAGAALFGHAIVAVALGVPAGAALCAGVRALSRSIARTRMRPDRMDAWDRALSGGAVVVAMLALAARALPSARWYAYPTFAWPLVDARLVALAVCLTLPVVLAEMRRARLRRASVGTPVFEEAA